MNFIIIKKYGIIINKNLNLMCNNRLKCAGSILLVSFGLMSTGVGIYEYLQYSIYLKT